VELLLLPLLWLHWSSTNRLLPKCLELNWIP
jgi:hypothetical protein